MIYFQWMNFVTAQIPPGKRRLLINMDEAALAYSWAGQKGTVICQNRPPQGLRPRLESVNRNEIRGNVTHMAFICDDSAIQPRLPQILLGNKARFTLRLLQSLQGEVPANVHCGGKSHRGTTTPQCVKLSVCFGKPFSLLRLPIILSCCWTWPGFTSIRQSTDMRSNAGYV